MFLLLVIGGVMSRRGAGQREDTLASWIAEQMPGARSKNRGSVLTSTGAPKPTRMRGDGLARGVVTDVEGHPLSGAQVCAYQDGGLRWSRGDAPLCERTDPNGRYALALYSPATYLVHASARGYVPGPAVGATPSQQVQLAQGASISLDFALAPGGVTLSGRVEDLFGGVIEDAWISTHPQDLKSLWVAGIASAVSADDGSFELWLGPGEVNVRAGAAGYAEAQRWSGAPAKGIAIVLVPESKLSGTVVDGVTGQPVEGAWVASASYAAQNIGFGGQGTLTDADGHFTLTGLTPGRYRPVARAAGRYGESPSYVSMLTGESAEVLITVEPAGDLSVQTVFADDQSPCADATLMLSDVQFGPPLVAKSDQDGMAAFVGVTPGKYRVSADCPGARSRYEAAIVTVDLDSHDAILVELKRGRKIRGVVVDADGVPVPGALVSAGSRGPADSETEWSGGQSQPTGTDGVFEIIGLGAGLYGLDVYGSGVANGAANTQEITLTADQDRTDVRIVIQRAASWRGRVLSRAGRPVSGILVQLTRGGPQNIVGGAVTDEDGYFQVAGVVPGPVRIDVLTMAQEQKRSELRFSQSEDSRPSVDSLLGNTLGALPQMLGVSSGGITNEELDRQAPGLAVLELNLEAGSKQSAPDKVHEIVVDIEQLDIRGCITDHEGSPVAGVFVNWYASGIYDVSAEHEPVFVDMNGAWLGAQRPVVSGDNGCFVIPGLPSGVYAVMASTGSGAAISHNGVAAGTSIQLELPAMGSLEGNVQTASSTIAASFVVTLSDEQHGYWRTEEFRAVGGAWSFDDVPAGTYTVSVEGLGGGQQSPVRIQAGQTTRVETKLPAPATLRGRVLDSTGKPAAGALVNVSTEGLRSRFAVAGQVQTDANGRYVVEQVAVGKVFVSASQVVGPEGGGGYGGPVELTLRSGESGNVPDVTLSAAWNESGEMAELEPAIETGELDERDEEGWRDASQDGRENDGEIGGDFGDDVVIESDEEEPLNEDRDEDDDSSVDGEADGEAETPRGDDDESP